MMFIVHRVIQTPHLLVIVSVHTDGWFLIGCSSEDSQMDWVHAVIILREYHVEISPPAAAVSTQFVTVLLIYSIS